MREESKVPRVWVVNPSEVYKSSCLQPRNACVPEGPRPALPVGRTAHEVVHDQIEVATY